MGRGWGQPCGNGVGMGTACSKRVGDGDKDIFCGR